MLACVTSEAETVGEPAVFKVTEKLRVPPTSAASAGRLAFGSLEVKWAVSLVLIGLNVASTAFTVTAKDDPAVCAEAVPLFPVAAPGTAISPDNKTCKLLNKPLFTVITGLVLGVFVPSSISVAVMVAVPAVRKVTLNAAVPDTRSALAGRTAFGSVDVI